MFAACAPTLRAIHWHNAWLDMRYTLSVLTAACLLALGQPTWSETADRELLQRARNAALALPDQDRACASQWLLQLQASCAATAPAAQRALPLNPLLQAVRHTLTQHYATTVSAHVLALPVVQAQWHRSPQALDMQAVRMQLDSTMVQRWIAPWQQEAA